MSRVISKTEFIAVMAMLMATVAFSIDSMLPSLPEIAGELTPDDPNRAQLVISSFMIGMGFGTLLTGPLSDSLGRKTIVIAGAVLYILGAALAYIAPSLEWLVAARVIQGIGGAGPRIVSMAIVRDLYSGREMARIISIIMIVFTIVPAMAPLIGGFVMDAFGWRSLFLAYILFSVTSIIWSGTRLPESLPKEARQPFRASHLWAAFKEMMGIPMVRLSIFVQMMIFSVLITSISLIQPEFYDVFGLEEYFAITFFAIGIFCMTSSVVNAKFVMRFGMRAIVGWSMTAMTGLSALMLLIYLSGLGGWPLFICFAIWQTGVFYLMGFTVGNLNTLGLEPLGYIAGLAASVIGSISTMFAAVFATIAAQMYNGTILPHVVAVTLFLAASLPAVSKMRKLERVASGPQDNTQN